MSVSIYRCIKPSCFSFSRHFPNQTKVIWENTESISRIYLSCRFNTQTFCLSCHQILLLLLVSAFVRNGKAFLADLFSYAALVTLGQYWADKQDMLCIFMWCALEINSKHVECCCSSTKNVTCPLLYTTYGHHTWQGGDLIWKHSTYRDAIVLNYVVLQD